MDQSTKAVLRLKVGEDFQGWKLRSVQGRETALEKDQQVVTLVLPQPGVGQVTSEVPPPPPGAAEAAVVQSREQIGPVDSFLHELPGAQQHGQNCCRPNVNNRPIARNGPNDIEV